MLRRNIIKDQDNRIKQAVKTYFAVQHKMSKTRLELVKFVAEKLGTEEPDEITSTTSPDTNYQRDIVSAVDTAWEEIQLMHEGVWHWRREQKTLSTVASTRQQSQLRAGEATGGRQRGQHENQDRR